MDYSLTHTEKEWELIPNGFFHFEKDGKVIHKQPTMTAEAYDAKIEDGWTACTKTGATVPEARVKAIAKRVKQNSADAEAKAKAEAAAAAKAAANRDPAIARQMEALKAELFKNAATEIEQYKAAALAEMQAATKPKKGKD